MTVLLPIHSFDLLSNTSIVNGEAAAACWVIHFCPSFLFECIAEYQIVLWRASMVIYRYLCSDVGFKRLWTLSLWATYSAIN